MTYDIYGFGNALVDFEIAVLEEELSKLEVKKSLMTLVDEDRQRFLLQHVKGKVQKKSCGGSAANTIITARQLGLNSFYACKVANDETGQFFCEDLKTYQVDSTFNHKKLPEGTTGKCLILISPDAERSMETFLGITQTVSDEEIHFESLKKSKLLYIEGYLVASPTAKNAAVKARQFCQENNIEVALTFSDPSMVTIFKEQMKDVIGKDPMDYIFANEKEALAFCDTNDLEEAIDILKKYAKIFVITRSERGAIAFDGNELIELPAFSVQPIDATGAGDVFAGAFLAAVKKGKSITSAIKIANFSAAKIVTKYGARLDNDQVAEIKSFIAEN